MDIGEIVSDAFKYPSGDWKNVLILCVFFILSAIIIGIFFWPGYLLRIVKATLAGYDDLPAFDEWGSMVVDSIKVIVVTIVYFIIPIIVFSVGIFAAIATIAATSTTNPFAWIGLIGGTGIIAIILGIIFSLIYFVALANMALYDELGAAFRFSEILERISQIGWGSYIIWWIVMYIIAIVFGIISSIISAIPYVGGFIAALIVAPYLYMLYARSLSLIFANSEEGKPAPAEEPASPE